MRSSVVNINETRVISVFLALSSFLFSRALSLSPFYSKQRLVFEEGGENSLVITRFRSNGVKAQARALKDACADSRKFSRASFSARPHRDDFYFTSSVLSRGCLLRNYQRARLNAFALIAFSLVGRIFCSLNFFAFEPGENSSQRAHV